MSKDTTIYLVRHGQTEYNITERIQGQRDVPLDETGLFQAELVGRRLSKKHFDVIYSSDLSRAAVTAAAIADGREIIYTRELREWHLGEWEGKLSTDVMREKQQNGVDIYTDDIVPGGESRADIRARAARFVDMLLEKHPGQEICCVTHGGLMRMIFASCFKLDGFPSRQIRTDNTCFSCIRYLADKNYFQLVFWNDINHLEGEALSSGW